MGAKSWDETNGRETRISIFSLGSMEISPAGPGVMVREEGKVSTLTGHFQLCTRERSSWESLRVQMQDVKSPECHCIGPKPCIIYSGDPRGGIARELTCLCYLPHFLFQGGFSGLGVEGVLAHFTLELWITF